VRVPSWMLGLALAAAVAVGLISVATAWRSPGLSAMSDSVFATAVALSAGYAMVAVGLEHVRRGRRRRFGVLLAAGGTLWLLADWANPAIGSSAGFTIGLALGSLAPAVVAHAFLVLGHGRLQQIPTAIVAIGYLIFGVALGLVPALTFDARAIQCSFCPGDLIAVAPSVDASGASVAFGTPAGAAASVVVAVVLAATLVRQTPAGRMLRAPVLVPGILFAVVVAIELGRAAGRSAAPADAPAHLLRLVESALLIAVAVGAAVEWLRARRSRTLVARVVADLGHSPPLGGLRDALASTLNDPDLRLAYPLPGGVHVDGFGRRLRLDAETRPGREITSIVREGAVVALLEHRSDVLETADTLDEVVRAARLGLEHERLQAETRAQLAELTAARRRIVAAAGGERQRLERDLHDGAQQHLIAVAIGARLLAAEASGLREPSAALVAEAGQEIALAIDELRTVAHGIYPSVLADEGFSAAVESLAEGSTKPIGMGDLAVDPLDLSIAEAAYAVVADVVEFAAGPVSVHAARHSGSLTLVVESPNIPADVLVELSDRVGAVDGVLRRSNARSGRIELVVEMPCAS
jgi:signal transduction histidine kinase